jgi:hypothetical protein
MKLSLWAWLFWGLPIYLVLEVVPFLIIGYGLKKTVAELVGPYLAFAVPAVILISLVWWLWVWEEQGTSPKRLARGWGTSVTLWGVSLLVATTYSGVKLPHHGPDGCFRWLCRVCVVECAYWLFHVVPHDNNAHFIEIGCQDGRPSTGTLAPCRASLLINRQPVFNPVFGFPRAPGGLQSV